MSKRNNEQFEIGLRDRFFELSAAGEAKAVQRYLEEVADVDVEPVLERDGLGMSFHPTARFKTVRFVPAAAIDEGVRPLFARPSSKMPHLAAVFVDPEEFSFRTFENIIPLDRWFEKTALDVSLAKRSKHEFDVTLSDDTRAALLGLDEMNLYVSPLNAASRGGSRFIFHAAALSEALTAAVRDVLPKHWAKGFSHVNPVFRLNRFEPDDAPFRPHVDTPYYDAARHHVSKYTMLIYLTGGEGDGVLKAGDEIVFDRIAPMTAIVFPQHLEHEGAPFSDGRKVFLRTELIFEDDTAEHEPRIAQMFAKATYLTGESVFAPELARYTHELYDRTAAAHFGAPVEELPEPVIEKRFRGVEFRTNGYDFWFDKQTATLKECAAIAVLDVLNGKIDGVAFKKESEASEPVFDAIDLAMLFPSPEAVDPETCCPFHCFETWDASRNDDTVELYTRAQHFARSRIDGAPINLLGQELFVDLEKFVIEGDKIHIMSKRSLAPVNFAACWNDGPTPSNHLDVETTVEAQHLLVPPILFVETEDSYHLRFDFFRNSWMVQHRAERVPVPKIRHYSIETYDEDVWESEPWLEAAARDTTPAEVSSSKTPWFADDSAVMDELYEGTSKS